jgi:hypothetical protein
MDERVERLSRGIEVLADSFPDLLTGDAVPRIHPAVPREPRAASGELRAGTCRAPCGSDRASSPRPTPQQERRPRADRETD